LVQVRSYNRFIQRGKIKMTKILFLTALVLGTAFGYVPIGLAQDSGFYAGLGINHISTKIEDLTVANQPINNIRNGPVSRFTSSHGGTHSNNFMIFGAYQINRFFAIETMYTTLGEYSRMASGASFFGTVNKTPRTYQTLDKLKLDGIGLSALANFPISDRLSAFGNFGSLYWRGKLTHATSFRPVLTSEFSPITSTDTDNGFSPMLGFGAHYRFKHDINLRVAWEEISSVGGNLSTGKSKVHSFSIGIKFKF
jgi:OmpA-OmpF porin, OOP family